MTKIRPSFGTVWREGSTFRKAMFVFNWCLIAGVGWFIWFLASNTTSPPAAPRPARPPKLTAAEIVARDAVEKYNIVVRAGGAMDVCVQAGFVKAAYLQTADEAKYGEWVKRERADCKRAGIE